MNKLDIRNTGKLHESTKHDSADKHVSGRAEYIDDIVEPRGTLHAYLGLASRAHAELASVDLDAVRTAPGVVGVLTAADIPGENDISSPHKHDDPVFAEGKVQFYGQPIFAVIGETRAAARRAATLAKIEYRDLPALLSMEAAVEAGSRLVTEPLKLERGDVETGMTTAPRKVEGRVKIGGQEHFYLESQIAFAHPGEDDDVVVYSSTQHPSEIQLMVANVLDVPQHAVTVNVRRMGGGFGGKETHGNLFAVVAALAAKKFNRAVKLRPDRDDDMVITGKRHDFMVDYEIGFDDDGRIQAVKATYAARGGFSADLSGPVTDRALFHCDNAYWYPAVRVNSLPLYTNTVSNTAFRGFGGPQGLIAAERWIEDIAYALGKDPLEIRKANFYGVESNNVTPYHQTVEDNIIHKIVEDIETSSDYQARRKAVLEFNRTSRVLKKGIALTPVKFGISFTATWYNQAGALVHVYRDGSIHLSHGGTEMGQGLHIKVAQVLADAFGVPVDRVKINATTTGKVPNTSATAASSGTDLNAMAALDGANQIKERLLAHAAEKFGVSREQVLWDAGGVRAGDNFLAFDDVIASAYLARVQLSAAGFYKTPKIHWDRSTGRGRPFYYYAYGAAVSEVTIDTLTGEFQVDRADVLEDVGRSLNPAIDIGQVEGGFIQGMGWLTTEELVWDAKGELRTHAPSTYKIPLASDVPPIFNVRLAEWSVNREPAVGRSKAVGEPPLCLAMSVVEAISMAVASVADYKIAPRLDMPATPERILMGVERMRKAAK
ncbi:xanthine dehydrogenase molybdopterin binding subunit [Paradevosia shaoguanensis]|uniref:Xanthine dehydrogenase molybdopterin binding subunit n=1 Tax=Paradevosia shaoguanensis TaxID=1335043 RepID=A0AA41QP98_9HYPH|nr:xanthine dehydrogenase molybdopterin binding subunit [Paradevosia shaoguanensis]MCF1743625.1 xanthine dehydrogenase molybdopterin binding subunit [Paradevosia shaoguanensis]MCI0128108.1 xanthine dehydrogenase molybdopterin binding subunit [Paradevosia shaoguanensis]